MAKSKKIGHHLNQIVANLSIDEIRTEQLHGREYRVAPVVMAVEGVMNELLYPADELSKFVEAWNGRPVTLFHPKDDGGEFISANSPHVSEKVHLGQLFNTVFGDVMLKSEVWIDVEKTKAVRPEVLEYLQGNKDKLEVSTGLWGDVIQTEGTFNETPYKGIMRNIRPDHLALLPGGEGACNWNQGCGLRANEAQDVDRRIMDRMCEKFLSNVTDRELRSALQKALDSQDRGSVSHYLEEIDLTKKEVVYEQYTRSTGDAPVSPESSKLYRRGYTFDKGEATLADSPVEVVRVVMYKPIGNEKGAKEVDKQQKIEALIKDPRTRFEAGCNDFLNGLNEDQLDRLMPPDNVVIKEDPPKTNLQEVVDKITKESFQLNQEKKPDAPPSATEWLSAQEGMPKEVRDSIMEGIALNAMQRAELIEAVAKDPRNLFTNDQLISKSTSELKALVAFTKPVKSDEPAEQPGFFGMRLGAAPVANDQVAATEPLVMKSLEDAFKANFKK